MSGAFLLGVRVDPGLEQVVGWEYEAVQAEGVGCLVEEAGLGLVAGCAGEVSGEGDGFGVGDRGAAGAGPGRAACGRRVGVGEAGELASPAWGEVLLVVEPAGGDYARPSVGGGGVGPAYETPVGVVGLGELR